ncbi:MAG TPA: amidohydrolase [Nitrolancea sp.]|jgi:amidohydrolase|nr:amidohydrolase [Nitrolancea sp.]
MTGTDASAALKDRVRARIAELMPELGELSDDIFAHPEIRFEEHHAAAAISDVLRRHQMDVDNGVAGLPTAFVARVPGHQSGQRVGILAEYDALPEIGHACGHNLIGTAAVGAFLALASFADELDGAVTLFGSPAEEGGAGKVIMLENDVFDGVGAAMMTHPIHTKSSVDTPFLAAGSVVLQFHGKPSHAAAAPEQGINALDALVMTYVGVNGLRQRVPKDVVISSIITNGGSAVNVIPDFAEIRYGARADKWERAAAIIEQIVQVAEGCAAAIGATVTAVRGRQSGRPQFQFATEDKQNDALKDIFRRNLDEVGVNYVPYSPEMGKGSTDFANLSQEIPGMHLMLELDGTDGHAPHTVEFARAAGSESGKRWLQQAAEVMALSAIDILNSEGALEEVREAFVAAE